MSIVTNTQWSVNANGSTGDLIFNEDSKGAVTGTLLGDPIDAIRLTGVSLSFVRHGNGFRQFYTGTAARADNFTGTDSVWVLMGMFTHLPAGGPMSSPCQWFTKETLIPG